MIPPPQHLESTPYYSMSRISSAEALEKRVSLFHNFVARGRIYKLFNLTLFELKMYSHYKSKEHAAYLAGWHAGFYDLKDLEIF
jgi:hypothetical protein